MSSKFRAELAVGASLAYGASLVSQNEKYTLKNDADGNIRIHNKAGNAIWASGSSNSRGELKLLKEGNLVLYNNDGYGLPAWAPTCARLPVWASMSQGIAPGPHKLVLQDDGNLVIYGARSVHTWASQTDGSSGTVVNVDGTDEMPSGVTWLEPRGRLVSRNKKYTFINQRDGNLCVYEQDHINEPYHCTWASNTVRKGLGNLYMQRDGNLIFYNSNGDGAPIWASGTFGRGTGSYKLIMQNDGNLVIYGADSKPIWATNTMRVEVKPTIEIWDPSSVSTQAADSSSNSPKSLQVNESLFELHRPLGIPTVQVVFFHGLQLGDYNNAHWSTWQSEDGSCVWPKTWLVEDIPGAHVLSVLYGQSLINMSDGAVDLYVIAENLLSDLLQGKIGQESDCPVVLVGHSFGGLVIKQLLRQANYMLLRTHGSEKMVLEAFLNSVTGIFYYSTPHQGSPVSEELAKVLGQSPMLDYFKTLNRDSGRLNYEFDGIWNSDERSLAGVGETRATDLGPFQGMIAPEASTRSLGVNFNLVDGADHFSICRPRDKFVRNFLKLKDFVVEATAHFQSPAARNYELIQSKLPNTVEGLTKGLLHSLDVHDQYAVEVHLEVLASRACYDKPSRVAMANEHGMAAVLAKLLQYQHSGIRQEAARLIFCLLAGKEEDDWIRSKILQEDGALAALVKFLSAHGRPYFQENAAGVLASLASGNEGTKETITNEPGAIAGLVKLLSKQNSGHTRTTAARALRNLASSKGISIKSKIGNEEGGIVGLVECLSVRDNPGLQEEAAGVLADLAIREPNRVPIAYEPGAITWLVKLLSKQNSGNARTAAARALRNLACSEVISIKSKIGNEKGAIASLVECLLVQDTPSLQEVAAGVLADLAIRHEPNRVAIYNEPGAIAGLLNLLSEKNDGVTRSEATRALTNLAISIQN